MAQNPTIFGVIFVTVIQFCITTVTVAEKSIYEGVKSSPYESQMRKKPKKPKKPCKDNQKNCVDDPSVPFDDYDYILLGLGFLSGCYFLYKKAPKSNVERLIT